MKQRLASDLSLPANLPGVSPEKQRLLFVDMFRGFATLVMIQGHVTNSTMLPAIRASREFHYLNLFNGMIAPSFIFIAGFALALALERKWDAFLRLDKAFRLQMRRLLFVLAVGYWLHLPTWSFRQLLSLPEEAIYRMLKCDVLQLISLSLMFSLFLAVVVRRKNATIWTLFTLAVANVFVTPFLYEIDWRQYIPPPFSDYINLQHYALFPIFPWAAYAMLGTFTGAIYLKARHSNRERLYFVTLGILGTLMLIAGFALFYVPWQYHEYADPSRSSPRHFMLKLGFVYMTLSGFWWYERKRNLKRSFLNTVGQESLFVYGLHLVIVYGAAFMPTNIAHAVGPVLSYGPSFMISFWLILSMCIVAIGWNFLKKQKPVAAKAVFYGLCAFYFIRFFLN